jgi:GT2 family glycosyltransferase
VGSVDACTASARFRNGVYTIRAARVVHDACELTDFWSDDRYQTSPDRRSVREARRSTLRGRCRLFGAVGLRLELTLDDVRYHLRAQ